MLSYRIKNQMPASLYTHHIIILLFCSLCVYIYIVFFKFLLILSVTFIQYIKYVYSIVTNISVFANKLIRVFCSSGIHQFVALASEGGVARIMLFVQLSRWHFLLFSQSDGQKQT